MSHLTDEQLSEINRRRREKGRAELSRRDVERARDTGGEDIDLTTVFMTAAFFSHSEPVPVAPPIAATESPSYSPPDPSPSVSAPDGGSFGGGGDAGGGSF